MSSARPDTYTLSTEELQSYQDQGYFVVKEFFDVASLSRYKKRFTEICNGTVERGFITIVKEKSLAGKGLKGEDIVNKINDIHCDDVFMDYTENPRLLHVLSQIIGPDIRVYNSMFINKPPGSVRHPPHQDLAYFPFRPVEKITAAWTAVDHVTEQNGGLYIIPGSHKPGVLHEHQNLPDSIKLFHGILDESVCPAHQKLVLTMAPGDTVFFHPLVVHGSGPNMTKNHRKCISAHYASEHCHYEDVSVGPQAHVVRDLEAESRRRGLNLNFAEVWKFKGKLVAGGVKSKL